MLNSSFAALSSAVVSARDSACFRSRPSCAIRSDTSRRMMVYVVPDGVSIDDTDASMGNGSPLARCERIDSGVIVFPFLAAPAFANSAKRFMTVGRSSGGKNCRTDDPSAAVASLPNTRSAALLNNVTVPASSTATMASMAVPTMSLNRASDWNSSFMCRSSMSWRSATCNCCSCSAILICLRCRSTSAATFDRRISGWNGLNR